LAAPPLLTAFFNFGKEARRFRLHGVGARDQIEDLINTFANRGLSDQPPSIGMSRS
jgi:hypothetical protein